MGYNSGLRLGALIAALDKLPQGAPVQFGYNDKLAPKSVNSYRGYYEDLAVQPSEAYVTVQEFRGTLKGAVGHQFTGYKGGTFTMDAKSTVWVSAWGECWDRCITGFKLLKVDGVDVVSVITKKEE